MHRLKGLLLASIVLAGAFLAPLATGHANFASAAPHPTGIMPAVTDPIAIGSLLETVNMNQFWGASAQFGNHVTTAAFRQLANDTPIGTWRFADGTDATNWTSNVTWTAGAGGGTSGATVANIPADWTFCREIRSCSIFETGIPAETNSLGDMRTALQFLVNNGIHPTYVSIGNEPQGWTHFNIPWANWKTGDAVTPTGLQYARVVQNATALVNSILPGVKIIGIESSNCGNDTYLRNVLTVDGPNISAVACHTYGANSADVNGAGLQQFYNVLLSSGNNPATVIVPFQNAVNFYAGTYHLATFIDELNAISGIADPAGFNGYMGSYPDFVFVAGEMVRALQSTVVSHTSLFRWWASTPVNYAAIDGAGPFTLAPTFDWYAYFAENITGGTASLYATLLAPTVRPVFTQFSQNSTTDSLFVINANATTSETVGLPSGINTGFGAKAVVWNNTTMLPVVTTYTTNPPSSITLAPQEVLLIDTNRIAPAGVVTPVIQSSAPTVYFTNAYYNYVLTASVPVNWTKVSAPAGFTLAGGSPSTQVDLTGTQASAGSQTFSIEATGQAFQGSVNTWQNWTVNFLAEPYISSVPFFTPTAGSFYDYKPTAVNTGGATWTFSGASWLTFNSGSGEVSGTVGAGTFFNQLTLNTSIGTWKQVWWISTNGLPSSITFTARVAAHTFNVTLPTTDITAGGNGGIFLGELIQAAPVANANSEAYTIQSPGNSWNASFSIVPSSGTPSPNLTVYYYTIPGTGVFPFFNGANQALTVTPSSGVIAFNVVPTNGPPVPIHGGGPAPCPVILCGPRSPITGNGSVTPLSNTTLGVVLALILIILGIFTAVLANARRRGLSGR